MNRRVVAMVAGGLVLALAGWWWLGTGGREPAVARNSGGRALPVTVARVQRQLVPVMIETLGRVEAVTSVALRPRIDSTVVEVHVADGARVQAGDLLITLDSRQVRAQIRQAEAETGKMAAQLAGAQRDLDRNQALAQREVASRQALDAARTQVDVLDASVKSAQAALEALKVQLSFTEIRAPIAGRIGVVAAKTGSSVRAGDAASPILTIQQTSPIYVAFAVPQGRLAELAQGWKSGQARIDVTIPGAEAPLTGTPAMFDNSIEAETSAITARALFDNTQEVLWPGAQVSVRVILRREDALVVPVAAVQQGQSGPYVYLASDQGVAQMRPVVVVRSHDGLAVLDSGVTQGENIIIEGQVRLTDGAKIEVRPAPASRAPAS